MSLMHPEHNVYIYTYTIIMRASRAQWLTELYYGIILQDYTMEIYYGIILRDTIMELYYGLYYRIQYGIMSREYITG